MSEENKVDAAAQPYTVHIEKQGCEHCAAQRTYSVVFHADQPDELASSSSYEDRDYAESLADMLNVAYVRGQNVASSVHVHVSSADMGHASVMKRIGEAIKRGAHLSGRQ